VRKIELAEKSYGEVLDATKHQDDKVGRVITAAAFLTVGALALVTHTFAPSVDLILPGARLPIVSIAIGIFLACTAFAVVGLLLSLSTPHVFLSELRPNYKSLIFFHEIGLRSEKDWIKLWSDPDEQLEKDLTDNFILESLNLARRVRLKYRRTYAAVRVLQVGVFYLALGAIAFLLGFIRNRPTDNYGHPFAIYPNYLLRSLFFIGIVSYVWLELTAIRDQSRHDRRDWTSVLNANQRYIRRTTSRLCWGILAGLVWYEAVLTFLPTRLVPWTVLVMVPAGLGSLFALRRPECERTQLIDGKCHPINGGTWTGNWSRRRLFQLVALGIWLATMAIGLVISVVDSGESRFAAVAALPLLVLAAGIAQRGLSRGRGGAPGDEDGVQANGSQDGVSQQPTLATP
jgi:hypothetical protein